jgi:acid phosphatase
VSPSSGRRPTAPAAAALVLSGLVLCTGCLDRIGEGALCRAAAAPTQNGLQWMFALGDWGSGGPGQKAVAATLERAASRYHPRHVLLLGDNFYETGVTGVSDPQWQTKFEAMYVGPDLQIPFYAVLGNHDYLTPGSADAEVAYSALSTRWRMPQRYYTLVDTVWLDQARSVTVRYVALETDALVRGVQVDEQLSWLDSVLTVNTADWTVAFGHHPMFGSGAYGDTPVLDQLVQPRFETGGVQVYLAGHAHNLQVIGSRNGITYVISGGGAGIDLLQPLQPMAGLQFGRMAGGFVAIGVGANELAVDVIDQDDCRLFSSDVPAASFASNAQLRSHSR